MRMVLPMAPPAVTRATLHQSRTIAVDTVAIVAIDDGYDRKRAPYRHVLRSCRRAHALLVRAPRTCAGACAERTLRAKGAADWPCDSGVLASAGECRRRHRVFEGAPKRLRACRDEDRVAA